MTKSNTSTIPGLNTARGFNTASSYNRFSYNQAPAAGDAVWPTSTAYTEAATAELCNVTSASANDAAAGTGARTISITGVNDAFAVVTETVTMNGTSNVSTVNKFWNIHSAYVLTAGSGGAAAGAITIITTASGTPTLDSIQVTANQSQSSVYMVPVANSAYLNNFLVAGSSVAANSVCVVDLQVKEFGGVFRSIERFFLTLNNPSLLKIAAAPIKVPAKALIKYQIISLTTFTEVSASHSLVLVPDALLS